jgi:natural product precursor
MKKKKETKKLTLNKITIAQLDIDKMSEVKGGSRVTVTVYPPTIDESFTCA